MTKKALQKYVNGAAIREIRVTREMSIVELAAQVSCNEAHISNIEALRRDASPKLAREIAAALKCRVIAILRHPEGEDDA